MSWEWEPAPTTEISYLLFSLTKETNVQNMWINTMMFVLLSVAAIYIRDYVPLWKFWAASLVHVQGELREQPSMKLEQVKQDMQRGHPKTVLTSV